MVRSRSAVSPLAPSQTAREALPAELSRPPLNPAGLSVAPEARDRTDEQSSGAAPTDVVDADYAPESPPQFEPPAHPGPAKDAAASEAASPNSGAAAGKPRGGPTVKFTLDVPLDLHRAMKLQTIRRRTTIVATMRQILSNYYGVTADISPGERKPAAGEPTKRLTLDLDSDLHTEMMLQKVLRGANIQAEVLYLATCHYLPGE